RWAPRLTPEMLKRLGLGLAIGLAGALIADAAHVPLAWMLGPLFLCMGASVAGLPAEVPLWMRANFMVLIGLFLGESFEGMSLDDLVRWPISMAGSVLYMPVATGLAYLYYRRLVREAPMTALCSSIPGGVTAVVLVSGALGADERHVALAQSLRVAFVVCLAPLIAFGALGYRDASGAAFAAQELISLSDLAVLLGTSAALFLAVRRTNLPVLTMLCPLVASAVLRLAGLIEGVLPHWLVEIGLLVLGASIGGRFAGVALGRLLRFGLLTFWGTAILMLVAALFAWGVAAITGLPLIALLLAYAPGGVAEMSLIAFAIDADPGFVALHHVVRIVFVMIMVPLMAVWFGAAKSQPRSL
ncbi:MAG: AbrB family transcriptional regulator, partial [Pseudomonadota bacterium]